MQYVILAYESQDAFALRKQAVRTDEYFASWRAYTEAIRSSGIVRGGVALQAPETATTVSLAAGKRQVQDGPFADTKEQLGGYFVVEVPDLDAALTWAERCPSAEYASVEVRPLLPTSPAMDDAEA